VENEKKFVARDQWSVTSDSSLKQRGTSDETRVTYIAESWPWLKKALDRKIFIQ